MTIANQQDTTRPAAGCFPGITLPELLALSDQRDAALRARQAAEAEGFRQGFAEGFAAGAEARSRELLAEIDQEKRLRSGILQALSDSRPPAGRWHLCCPACRRGGHRGGCRDCQDRTRETFGDPMRGDFPGLGSVAQITETAA